MRANLNPQVASVSTGAIPAAVDSRPAPKGSILNRLEASGLVRGERTTASCPRGTRQSRATPSVAGSRVPDPPRGVAPPPGPRPFCAMRFRSAPLYHPRCAECHSRCAEGRRGLGGVQGGPHAPPLGGAHHYHLPSRPNLDGSCPVAGEAVEEPDTPDALHGDVSSFGYSRWRRPTKASHGSD